MGRINLDIHGHLHFVIRNEDTGAVREYEFDNIATSALLNAIARSIGGINGAVNIAKFMMGTGTGTVASTDVALFTPVAGTILSVAGKAVTNNQILVTINYPKNAITGTFKEGGLLDPNNLLLTHALLTPNIQVVANESVTILYTLTVNS